MWGGWDVAVGVVDVLGENIDEVGLTRITDGRESHQKTPKRREVTPEINRSSP
jgi:hypothetical protein